MLNVTIFGNVLLPDCILRLNTFIKICLILPNKIRYFFLIFAVYLQKSVLLIIFACKS